MRRGWRYVGAAAAAPALTCLVFSGAARADNAVGTEVTQTNWYWDDPAASNTAQTPIGTQSSPKQLSGVPDGDLAVAYTGGSSTDPSAPSKETYVAFDLSALPSQATISGFSFTIPLDPGATQGMTQPPDLVACEPSRVWGPGQGTSYSDKPDEDCTGAPSGKYDATEQSYTFTITPIAQDWLQGNVGVAIRNSPKYTTPFQLVFKGASAIRGTLTFAPVVTTPTNSNTTTATSTQPASQPVAPTTNVPSVSVPAQSGPLPAQVGPVSQPPAPAVAPAKPQASIRHAGSSMPPAAFWIAGVGLLVALIVSGLVLDDRFNGGPPTGRRGSRLDRVLRQRQSQQVAVGRPQTA